MWRWNWQENGSAAAFQTLSTLTGTIGERFTWTLSGSRAANNKTYLVRLPPVDVVVVAEGSPLSVGQDGAKLLTQRLKLLKGDFEVFVEGEFVLLG